MGASTEVVSSEVAAGSMAVAALVPTVGAASVVEAPTVVPIIGRDFPVGRNWKTPTIGPAETANIVGR
jgi:hypothetical protein